MKVWFAWIPLLDHCFIGILIWLISPMPPLFYCYLGWLPSSIGPLFYWHYNLVDFFYCSTIFLQLSFGCFLLFHHCFLAIKILLILFDFYYTTVLLEIRFVWSVLLHRCFIGIMIRLISSFSRLFDWNYYLADSIWFLLHHCFISTMICLISSIARLFYCNYDSADFFFSTTF